MHEQSTHNPFKEAHKLRLAGRKAEFPGTNPLNRLELPEGGRHELTDGKEHSLDSKAMKAAKFINDAERAANTGEFQLPEPHEPGPENEMNEAA